MSIPNFIFFQKIFAGLKMPPKNTPEIKIEYPPKSKPLRRICANGAGVFCAFWLILYLFIFIYLHYDEICKNPLTNGKMLLILRSIEKLRFWGCFHGWK
jgi:hypothetical protein